MKARWWSWEDNAVLVEWVEKDGPAILHNLGLMDYMTPTQVELLIMSKLNSQRCALVAVTSDDGEVIGLGMADSIDPEGCAIGMFVMSPDHRGMGAYAEKRAIKFVYQYAGVKTLTALVEPHNQLAIDMHQRIGFKIPDVVTMVMNIEEAMG
jgi:RimJ/RimL family protein N-acetyltransferase